jgi:two-component system, LytTR family, response regulator
MENKIKTILIDDELPGLSILEHYCSEYTPELHIIGAYNDPFEALEKIQKLKPELVIMDIQMPNMNAFELLSKSIYKAFDIIFTTAYDEYAITAFKYSATDYLLKPINEDLFVDAVNKVIKKNKSKSDNSNLETLLHNFNQMHNYFGMKLCITDAQGFQVIELGNILYCEAEGSYTKFHLNNNKTLLSSKSLAEYEPILGDKNFFRIHKSYIVNLSQVLEFNKRNGGEVIMPNGQSIEVSRRKKNEFIELMKGAFK